MKKILSLIALFALTQAYAGPGIGHRLVAWYPFTGTLANRINPNQMASLLDGAELQSDSVAMTTLNPCASYDGSCPGTVQIPAPFTTPTSVFTTSLQVLETGLSSLPGGAYLTAGNDSTSVLLMTHFWADQQSPEGSYYGLVQAPGPMTNEFLAPLELALIENHWVHYVLVSDTDSVSLYKDGVKVGVMNNPGLPVSGDWFIGRHWWLTFDLSVVYSERVLGNFKNLRVYSRALSDSDVRDLYQHDSQISHLR